MWGIVCGLCRDGRGSWGWRGYSMQELKWVLLGMLKALGVFFPVAMLTCAALTWTVRDSHDGQAGMGAAFGGLYLGAIAGLVTFVISLRRDCRRATGRE